MTAPAPFFVGSARSGTTLIREIFDRHPDLSIPEETHFLFRLAWQRADYETPTGFDIGRFIADLSGFKRFGRFGVTAEAVRATLDQTPPTDLPDAIRGMYRTFAREHGTERWGDKTPRYCLHMPLLATLLPEARFIHVVRDGRDVALSLRSTDVGPKSLEGGALFWRNRALVARRDTTALGPGRAMEYRHEDLIREPEVVVRTICSFIDLTFDAAMLEAGDPRAEDKHGHAHESPRAGLRDWRTDMEVEELRLVEILAGDALDHLGYERATDSSTLSSAAEELAHDRAAKARRRHAAWEAARGDFTPAPVG